MRYFTNLYLVEALAGPTGVQVNTTIYGAQSGAAYFSWGAGARPAGAEGYAADTVFCESALRVLPGYPMQETRARLGQESAERYLIEARFTPQHADDPVLYHFLLPERFVPARIQRPFALPAKPSVRMLGERLVATFPVVGAAEIAFGVAPRPETQTGALDLTTIFEPMNPEDEFSWELNLGLFKFSATSN